MQADFLAATKSSNGSSFNGVTTITAEQKSPPKVRQYCPTLTRLKVIEEGALIVDVRERDEVQKQSFDVAHLVNIPMSEFEQRFAELPRDRELILVCAQGLRSFKATYFLMCHGYDKVANLEGGQVTWIRKGFSVRGDVNADGV